MWRIYCKTNSLKPDYEWPFTALQCYPSFLRNHSAPSQNPTTAEQWQLTLPDWSISPGSTQPPLCMSDIDNTNRFHRAAQGLPLLERNGDFASPPVIIARSTLFINKNLLSLLQLLEILHYKTTQNDAKANTCFLWNQFRSTSSTR